MKAINCKRKTIAFWIFVFIITTILFLTLQNSQDTLALSGTVTKCIKSFMIHHELSTAWISEGVIRKIAHIVEYFFLGICAMLAISAGGRRVYFSLPISLMICSAISSCDQILKDYLPTREFDVADLIFDAVGYVTGIAIITVIIILFRIICWVFKMISKSQLHPQNQL